MAGMTQAITEDEISLLAGYLSQVFAINKHSNK
jgi:hypothetical protein